MKRIGEGKKKERLRNKQKRKKELKKDDQGDKVGKREIKSKT